MAVHIERLIKSIDDEEVVQVTRDLVAIPSITAHENRDMVDYMEHWFDDLGIPYREYPIADERVHLFADFGKTHGTGRFIFNGHQDTKPVDGMTVDPFAGEIRNGRLYGRGACDMKSGIAAVLCAFKGLVRTGLKPKGGITFYSDIEEETGGPNGYSFAIKQGLLDGYEGMISCEPSNLEVHIGDKGGITTCFEVKGKSVHSGLANYGVNAIQNMAIFITRFLDLPYLKKDNPIFGKSTVNFEKITGGRYLSTVPDYCSVCLDARLIPETPPEVVKKEIENLIDYLNREHNISIREVDPPKSWRPSGNYNACHGISSGHSLSQRVASAVSSVTRKEAVIAGCPGATLAGQMIARGTPAVICGPGSIVQAHTEDEWVRIEQIPLAARIYAMLMSGM